MDKIIFFWQTCKWKIFYVAAVSWVGGIMLTYFDIQIVLVKVFLYALILPFAMWNILMERAKYDVARGKREKYRTYVPKDVQEAFEKATKKRNAEVVFSLFVFVVCVIWMLALI